KSTYMQSPGGNKFVLQTDGRVSILMAESASSGLTPAAAAAAAAQVCQVRPSASAVVPGRRITEFIEKDVSEIIRMHEKLGHMSFDRMVRIGKADSTVGLKETFEVSR